MKLVLLLLLSGLCLSAADASGKWTGTFTPTSEGGGNPGPALLMLKQDGEKVTGTAGPDAHDQHTIQNGKAEGGTVTFEITNGNRLMKFVLRQDGDELKGDVTGERNGQTQTARLEVKREK